MSTRKPDSTDPITEFFGAAVHTYSRAQALADGVLIDVSASARAAGFAVPVALTQAAYTDCVIWNDDDNRRQKVCQDLASRLWDVLWMARCAVVARRHDAARPLNYPLYRVPRDGRSKAAVEVALKLVFGPGDAGEPVVTIMLPNED